MLASQQLTPKLYKNSLLLAKKTTINIRHHSSGQQADFSSVHYHHIVQLAIHSGDHMPEGSAQIPSGDTRLDMETGPSSYRYGTRELTSLSEKGCSNSCPESQATWGEGQTDCAGHRRNEKKLHSEWFMVPGAPDHRVLGTPNIVIVLKLHWTFLTVPGALLCWSTTDQGSGSSKVRQFLFFYSLHCSSTPHGSGGITVFIQVNFELLTTVVFQFGKFLGV